MPTTANTPSTDTPLQVDELVTIEPAPFSANEKLALAGFLAGYSGLTSDAYALDLREFISWSLNNTCTCSTPAAPTSTASPAT